MPTPLKGAWCLILGASSGMGRAIALALAAEGAHVAGVHLDTASAQDDVDELLALLRGRGGEVQLFNANAANPKTRARLVGQLAELVGPGRFRVFVHSLAFGSLAPYLPTGDTPAITPRQMDMTLDVMAHSLVYWAQDLHRAALIGEGTQIIALTSAGGVRVAPHYGAVSAAKCALESHVRQLALELAPHGVAVNALRAGVTPTPALRRIPGHEEAMARMLRANPHGRLTTTRDVGEAVALLSQSDSSWITGNVIGVDGGELLT
jgi:NAD(P)-dependent dehydrogenase (short-subunit alcohol dehydrogenase family)